MGRTIKSCGLLSLLLIGWLVLRCGDFPHQPQSTVRQADRPPIAIVIVDEGRTEFLTGERIKLDGSGSQDPDDPSRTKKLEYLWRTLNGGQLTDTIAVVTYFITDSSGKYVVALTVSDDSSKSQPALSTITIKKVLNVPTAAIRVSPADSTLTGVPITLDGSLSTDPNNDPLTFKWQSLDGGSIADSTARITTFVAAKAGVYVISLSVSDGVNTSVRALATVTVKELENHPPFVIVKADTIVDKNSWAKLDASASRDPEGESIRFAWRKLNGGELANTDSAMTRFRANEPSLYVIALRVMDQRGKNAETFLKVQVRGQTGVPHPPIANAGEDQTTFIEQPVLLDGSASFDPDGDPLRYSWRAFDGGKLENQQEKKTRFLEAPKTGTYRVALTVNDGQRDSRPDTVRVIVLNRAPVAVAGNDTTVKAGEKAFLNGSRSRDLDGDALTYRWESLDGGQIANPAAKITTFMSNVVGNYNISLIVHDGKDDSKRDFIKVNIMPSKINTAPIANAGNDDTTTVGLSVKLDGSLSSDVDFDQLTFEWTALNGGTISNSKAAMATFAANRPGNYVIALVVHDGQAFSTPDYKAVLVREPSLEIPVADAGRDTTVLPGEKVQLDGSKSKDPRNRPLNFHWIGVETNPASVTLPNLAKPEFTPPLPGKYSFILYVDNGQQTSAPDNDFILRKRQTA
jgi:hypothetical protein